MINIKDALNIHARETKNLLGQEKHNDKLPASCAKDIGYCYVWHDDRVLVTCQAMHIDMHTLIEPVRKCIMWGATVILVGTVEEKQYL